MKKSTILICSLGLLFASALFAQDQKASMPDCAAMMKHEEAMQKHMAEMDAKLAKLVDAMNTAKGSAKVDRMAAVINELVSQRAMMRDEMARMQPEMMQHMMQHMQSGMKNMSESMDCPMMKSAAAPAEQKH